MTCSLSLFIHLIVCCTILTLISSFSIKFTKTDCNVSNKTGTSDPFCFITNGALNIGVTINKDLNKAYVRIFQGNLNSINSSSYHQVNATTFYKFGKKFKQVRSLNDQQNI